MKVSVQDFKVSTGSSIPKNTIIDNVTIENNGLTVEVYNANGETIIFIKDEISLLGSVGCIKRGKERRQYILSETIDY